MRLVKLDSKACNGNDRIALHRRRSVRCQDHNPESRHGDLVQTVLSDQLQRLGPRTGPGRALAAIMTWSLVIDSGRASTAIPLEREMTYRRDRETPASRALL